MPPAAELDPTKLAVVTVSYNPEPGLLATQLAQLPADALKVIVDNASAPELASQVRALANAGQNIRFEQNDSNLGLAAALNQGVALAARAMPECEYVLLLDQDTETGVGGAQQLLAAFVALRAVHPRLGAVGPRLIDESTGLEHGFHQIAGWRWVRRFPVDDVPLPIDNINGSGLLMPLALYRELGGMRESFFVDHVDTEWAFRLRAAGRELYGVPGVRFRHRMGIRGIRFWAFGWRVGPYRSPARHFFLFRNSVRLLRDPAVPGVWKLWAPMKLAATFVAHLLLDHARWRQSREMLRGLFAGLRERSPAG
jgi:rhamnosyltransferase